MQSFNFFYVAYLFIWGADVVYKKRRVNADSWSPTEIATYTYMCGAAPTDDTKTLGSLSVWLATHAAPRIPRDAPHVVKCSPAQPWVPDPASV
jgi:hypothetical protein